MNLGNSSVSSDLETMPPDAGRKYRNDRLRRIVKLAYERAPAVRTKMDQAGVGPEDIRSPKNLETIPITSNIVDINAGIPLGPGNVGRVVLTPLGPTLPLIRFSPGDLSSWKDRPCPFRSSGGRERR